MSTSGETTPNISGTPGGVSPAAVLTPRIAPTSPRVLPRVSECYAHNELRTNQAVEQIFSAAQDFALRKGWTAGGKTAETGVEVSTLGIECHSSVSLGEKALNELDGYLANKFALGEGVVGVDLVAVNQRVYMQVHVYRSKLHSVKLRSGCCRCNCISVLAAFALFASAIATIVWMVKL